MNRVVCGQMMSFHLLSLSLILATICISISCLIMFNNSVAQPTQLYGVFVDHFSLLFVKQVCVFCLSLVLCALLLEKFFSIIDMQRNWRDFFSHQFSSFLFILRKISCCLLDLQSIPYSKISQKALCHNSLVPCSFVTFSLIFLIPNNIIYFHASTD